MRAFSALILAATAAFAAPLRPDEPIIPGTSYGAEVPTYDNAQWIVPSKSYSNGPYKQAIFLSFDGLHQFDVLELIAKYPNSTFNKILKNSVVYSNAKASSPSDSFPATTALYTGSSPRNSGKFSPK